MVTVVYKGIKKEHQEKQINAALRLAKPPEQRGERNQNLNISSKDRTRADPAVLHAKEKAIKKWREDFEKDTRQSVAEADAKAVVLGVVFEKGKPVDLQEDHPLFKKTMNPKTNELTGPSKLDGLIKGGSFEIVPAKSEKKAG